MAIKIIKWNEAMSVGNDLLDGEHRTLIALTNKLVAAYYAGVGSKVVVQVFQEILDYTKVHFANEEDYLREIGYPDYEAHCEVHRKFVAGLDGVDLSGSSLLTTLSDWLVHHILQDDARYRDYLAQRTAVLDF